MSSVLFILAFLLGVVGRLFVPFAIARMDDNQMSFCWPFANGQLVGAIVGLALLVVLPAVHPLAAFAMGWTAGDLGREIQKATTILQATALTPHQQVYLWFVIFVVAMTTLFCVLWFGVLR